MAEQLRFSTKPSDAVKAGPIGSAISDPVVLAQRWLSALLSQHQYSNLVSALVVVGSANDGPFEPAAYWPNEKAATSEHMRSAAERAMNTRLQITLPTSSGFVWAQPLVLDKAMYGVFVVEMAQKQFPLSLREQFTLGEGWLYLPWIQRSFDEVRLASLRLELVMEQVMAIEDEPSTTDAYQAMVTNAAAKLNSDRVALGFVKKGKVKLQALSSTSDFEKRIDMVQLLEAAMTEALEQGRATEYSTEAPPEPLTAAALRAHLTLCRDYGSVHVLAVPFTRSLTETGVVLFEWAQHPGEDQLALARSIVPVVGPIVLSRRHSDRPMRERFVDWCRLEKDKLFGAQYGTRKLVYSSLLFVIAFFTFAHGEFRVAANSQLEGSVRRQIAAPYDGFVASAAYRAGQTVKKGELLATLDDKELMLEAQRWLSQQDQYSKQAQDAQAQSDLPQIQIVMAQVEQARAQLELSESQLERTRITAPFDGLITLGDLSQSLGGAVKKGQVLFEIAPMDGYRVVLDVDEADISHLKIGQTGQLVVTSLPNEKFPFEVKLITPVAKVKDGLNYFRVEGAVLESEQRLRPGMEGVAKVYVDERRLIWIWTHRAGIWLRLKLWSWFGI